MRELRVKYETWKQVADANTSLNRYHRMKTDDTLIAYTGNESFVYLCDVGSSDCSHWQSTYETTSVAVVSNDDAIALIVGTTLQKTNPVEADGKRVLVISPSTEGWMTWFTGAGDDPNPTAPASGRGTGQKLNLNFTAPATKEVAVQTIEPVELHDGGFFYQPSDWGPADRWDFFVRMPASVVTVDESTTGNCNLVDAGGYNVIVPASDDGTHDVDLSLAVPVPADNAGYWDADHASGVVTASTTPGSAKWHLLDIQIESYFMRNMPLGNPLGVFDIDTYKAEWISERWKLVLNVVRATTGTGSVTGWLMLFREKST